MAAVSAEMDRVAPTCARATLRRPGLSRRAASTSTCV